MDGQIYYRETARAVAIYLEQELKLTLGQHYQIRKATNGPRVIVLQTVINPRYANRIMAMSEALSMAAGLNRGTSIRIDRGRGGTLVLEIPKPQELQLKLKITQLPRRHGLKATIGLDTEYRPTLVDFANPLTAHGLIAGTSGSGKTNAARLLVYDLASQNEPDAVQFLLIDLQKRGIGWRPFEHLPHLAHPVITEDRTALQALAWAVAELDRRALSGRTSPQFFVGIDEAQAMLVRKEFVRSVVDLTSIGREFGIHTFLVMQDPRSDSFGDTTIKRNLSIRLVGKVDSHDAAKVAAGVGGTGAERLIGSGDFLLVQPGDVKRLTTALLTDRDTDRLPYTDQVSELDLSEYEDIDHVLDQAESKADPLDPAHVAYALAYPGASQRAMYDRFKVGFPKIRRVQSFASEVLAELGRLGYSVCNGATVQRPDLEE